MCQSSGESIEHILLHCTVARDIWLFVFTLFGVPWVLPKMVVQMLSCWNERFHRHKSFKTWNGTIWREQNSKTRMMHVV